MTTLPATNVDTVSATLNGTVNANLLSTTVRFDYGLTTAYSGGSVYADQSPVTGSTDTAVSANLTGLIPMRTYHFRVVGNNWYTGDTPGEDMTFTTLGGPPTMTTLPATNVAAV